MSLYNMLFGVNSAAPVLLATLGLTAGDVPCFRDCYIDGDNIVIHTRTGGGNREDYEVENEELQSNPFYVRDEDDEENQQAELLRASHRYWGGSSL